MARLRALALTLLVALASAGATSASGCLPVPPPAPLPALAQVVRLLEPALPRSLIVGRLELPDGHPDQDALRYLRERRVIPRGANVDPMSPDVWAAAVATVAGWYDVAPPATGEPADPSRRADDLEALLRAVARALRPAALVAWSPDDGRRLEFLGLVWNWSAYPRLIVTRPDDTPWDGALRSAAARLDTCAYPVDAWIGAVAPVARDLFLAENRATMYVVGSEPELPGAWPYQVPAGDEVAVFAFTHPVVAGLDAFSAVFVGDPTPALTLVRVLPRVRTNLSPFGVVRILQTPVR